MIYSILNIFKINIILKSLMSNKWDWDQSPLKMLILIKQKKIYFLEKNIDINKLKLNKINEIISYYSFYLE